MSCSFFEMNRQKPTKKPPHRNEGLPEVATPGKFEPDSSRVFRAQLANAPIGKSMFQAKELKIDLSKFETGIYILEIIDLRIRKIEALHSLKK
jgi:hypothetical protein